MYRNFYFLAIILSLFVSTTLCANDLPSYLQAEEKGRSFVAPTHLLYDGEDISVSIKQDGFSTLDNSEMNREDLYACRFLNILEILPVLENYGKVLYLSPNKTEAIMSLTDQDKIDDLAALLHTKGGVIACGAIIKLSSPSEIIALEGIQTLASEELAVELADEIMQREADPRITSMTSKVNKDNIRKFVEELSAYNNRHHRSSTGAAAADHIFKTFSAIAQSNPDLSVRKVNHSNTPQPSIVATLRGTTKPNEKVIIGCHIDSINGNGSGAVHRHAPGADDNASGTATVKEIMQIISDSGIKFARTIEFHGYAAEEAGLLGSGNVAKEYKAKKEVVVGMIQIDMCLYNTGDKTIWLVSNDTSSKHNELAAHLVPLYTDTETKSAMLWGGTSDHRSWTRLGFHAIFPFENPRSYNRKIHTTGDTITSTEDFAFASNYGRLGIAYLASLAEIE